MAAIPTLYGVPTGLAEAVGSVLDRLVLGLFPGCPSGARKIRAGRDVVGRAVKHLTNSITGEVYGPTFDFELALLVLFDFHA